MRQSSLAKFGIGSANKGKAKLQEEAAAAAAAAKQASPSKKKGKVEAAAAGSKKGKASPVVSRSATPVKKPSSRVSAKPSPRKNESKSPLKAKKEETKTQAANNSQKDVEMKSQESEEEGDVAVRRRGRRPRQTIESDEEVLKEKSPVKAAGKKRTHDQVTRNASQATDGRNESQDRPSVKVAPTRSKVEERSEQSSQQSRTKKSFGSRRLRQVAEPNEPAASSLDLGGPAKKQQPAASSLDLGGGGTSRGRVHANGDHKMEVSEAPESTLDLGGGGKANGATSSLELGGRGPSKQTRSTRRNRDPSPELVQEETDEEEEKPQVLDGFTLVVSGVFNEISRESLEALISAYGGRVTGSVSGKTDYLVVGYKMEDNREVTQGGKYKKAKDKGKPILNEEQFQDLMRDKLGDKEFTLATKLPSSMPMSKQAAPSGPIDKSKNDMWTDRYRPQGFQDLIGNQGAVSQLYEWLKDWDEVCIRGNKKPLPIRRGMSWQDVQNVNARAALLSGPPGIGKTSAARIVCAQLGYEVVEQNASDVRNKGAIEHAIKDLSMNKSLDYFSVAGVRKASSNDNPMASAIGGLATQKSVIIMDEVDGVGAGDRGGIAALIKVIKSSKTPIICICNDRQSQKLASLVNHCFDLKFQRPQSNQIAQMVMKVAKSENIELDEEICANLIESSGNDIRQVINILQLWTQQAGSDSDAAKKFMTASKKDEKVMINNFEAAYRLLNTGVVPLDDKYPRFQQKLDLFFIDHDWVPLLVQESYLNSMGQRQELSDIEAMADAADFISLGDSINRQIRTNMDWGLLPQLGTCGAVAPVLLVKGHSLYPRFPEWLGKNSSQRKSFRQLRELKFAMGMQAQANKRAIQLEYVPVILSMLYKKMTRSDPEEAIALLSDFRITNEMFKEHLLDLCLSRKAHEAFEKLSTQQKSAFTRAYNKVHKDPTQGKKGTAGGKKGAADEDVSDSDEEKDAGQLLDEDEQAEIKRAKQRERDHLKAQQADKIEKFEMINPVVKGGADGAEKKSKGAKAAAKKGKAKTQKAGKRKQSEDDDLDGFIVDDDDEDAVKTKRGKKGKAKTAKGKK